MNISPPSSPDIGYSRNARAVSPVDDVSDMAALESRPSQAPTPSQPKSNIPMMRRQRRHQQEAANATLRAAQSRERMRSTSHGQQQQPDPSGQEQQPNSNGQEGDGASATGRQVFKMAQGRDMRWDGMTGEPTLGPTGISGQVKPAEYVQELKTSSGKLASASSSAMEKLRNAQGSFGDKVRRMRDGAGAGPAEQSLDGPVLEPQPEPVAAAQVPTAPATPPASSSPTAATRPPRKSSLNTRPEWKGGSGRTTLVPPVQDTPQTPPVHIPRKSSKRERHANLSKGARGSPGGPRGLLPLSPISPSGSETSLNRADPATRKLLSPRQATHGTAPDGQDPGNGSAAPPDHAQPETTPTAPAPVSLDHAKSVRRKPTPSAAGAAVATSSPSGAAPTAPIYPPRHESHLSTASSLYSTFDTRTVPHPSGVPVTVNTHLPKPSPAPANRKATTTPVEDNWVQPSSRFSITTYATSGHTRSPNQSIDIDAPPMPSPPRDDYSQPPQSKGSDSADPSAYMSSPYTSPAAELRKAAALGRENNMPSYLRSGGGAWQSSVAPSVFSDRPGSIASTTKALPLAPPEMMTVNDRVGHLNARLESLANRRININKGIMQMTELMPTDNLMASDAVLRKREIEKQKVEVLRDELAEVQREEYELGLKLHRAYKRLDRDAEYEPTGLWVRRVTG